MLREKIIPAIECEIGKAEEKNKMSRTKILHEINNCAMKNGELITDSNIIYEKIEAYFYPLDLMNDYFKNSFWDALFKSASNFGELHEAKKIQENNLSIYNKDSYFFVNKCIKKHDKVKIISALQNTEKRDIELDYVATVSDDEIMEIAEKFANINKQIKQGVYKDFDDSNGHISMYSLKKNIYETSIDEDMDLNDVFKYNPTFIKSFNVLFGNLIEENEKEDVEYQSLLFFFYLYNNVFFSDNILDWIKKLKDYETTVNLKTNNANYLEVIRKKSHLVTIKKELYILCRKPIREYLEWFAELYKINNIIFDKIIERKDDLEEPIKITEKRYLKISNDVDDKDRLIYKKMNLYEKVYLQILIWEINAYNTNRKLLFSLNPRDEIKEIKIEKEQVLSVGDMSLLKMKISSDVSSVGNFLLCNGDLLSKFNFNNTDKNKKYITKNATVLAKYLVKYAKIVDDITSYVDLTCGNCIDCEYNRICYGITGLGEKKKNKEKILKIGIDTSITILNIIVLLNIILNKLDDNPKFFEKGLKKSKATTFAYYNEWKKELCHTRIILTGADLNEEKDAFQLDRDSQVDQINYYRYCMFEKILMECKYPLHELDELYKILKENYADISYGNELLIITAVDKE